MLQRPVVSESPAKHLASEAGELPVHFFAPSALEARLRSFKAHFPGVVTYAVKANPADHVISQLWAGGLDGFDVASPDEISLIQRLCPGAAMHYNNPVRSRAEIKFGIEAGVVSWSVDDMGELEKLISCGVPQASEVAVRFKLPVAGGAYNFGAKFGATEDEATALLRRVAEALRPEILARVPDQLVFARLTPDVQREIAGLHLANEVARLKSVGFDLEVSREALEFLIREGFHPQLGARPLRQTIERQLQDTVVRGLFASGVGAGRVIFDPTINSLALIHR